MNSEEIDDDPAHLSAESALYPKGLRGLDLIYHLLGGPIGGELVSPEFGSAIVTEQGFVIVNPITDHERRSITDCFDRLTMYGRDHPRREGTRSLLFFRSGEKSPDGGRNYVQELEVMPFTFLSKEFGAWLLQHLPEERTSHWLNKIEFEQKSLPVDHFLRLNTIPWYDGPLWCLVKNEEYPPEGELGWSWDGSKVGKARWDSNYDGVSDPIFKNAKWTNEAGEEVTGILAWLWLDENPSKPPEVG